MDKILIILLLLSFIQIVFNCTCMFTPPKKSWCRAKWISYVKIEYVHYKRNSLNGDIIQDLYGVKYKVRHLEVFKKPRSIKKLSKYIYTPSISALCGVPGFRKNIKIYIMGNIDENNRLTINACTSLNFHYMKNGKISKSDLKILRKKKYKPCK
uniref:NTR domain-containing protein n=1 Tax=Strongyloides stercoralis TaxID=6248 RepID=A0A0K0DY94_STRER